MTIAANAGDRQAAGRPAVVAFDIIETVFSLESLRGRLGAEGAAGDVLELWFARALRDAFAMAATGRFAPFREVLKAALADTLEERGTPLPEAPLARILDGFAALDPHEDAGAAFRHLHGDGIRILALSNGAASTTDKLLERAGLKPLVERTISVEEVGLGKPRVEVYRHAAKAAGVPPGQLALVAAHPWDVHGARCAGLIGAFVARGRTFPPFLAAPDIAAPSLLEVARQLASQDAISSP